MTNKKALISILILAREAWTAIRRMYGASSAILGLFVSWAILGLFVRYAIMAH